jgi:hypothetical protein
VHVNITEKPLGGPNRFGYECDKFGLNWNRRSKHGSNLFTDCMRKLLEICIRIPKGLKFSSEKPS